MYRLNSSNTVIFFAYCKEFWIVIKIAISRPNLQNTEIIWMSPEVFSVELMLSHPIWQHGYHVELLSYSLENETVDSLFMYQKKKLFWRGSLLKQKSAPCNLLCNNYITVHFGINLFEIGWVNPYMVRVNSTNLKWTYYYDGDHIGIGPWSVMKLSFMILKKNC